VGLGALQAPSADPAAPVFHFRAVRVSPSIRSTLESRTGGRDVVDQGRTARIRLLLPRSASAEGSGRCGAPTVADLSADEDRDVVKQLVEWHQSAFTLPHDARLDEHLRQSATTIAQEQVARVQAQAPVWIAQERAFAGDATLRRRSLSQPACLHAINEMAI
jgi:hypothetical protein